MGVAEVVLGIATSHSPQLSTPAELWKLHRERDRQNRELHFRGKVYDFDTLAVIRRDEHIEREIADEIWLDKYKRCERAIGSLADSLHESNPDVLVIIGDDQRELFLDDGMPTFAVFWGNQVECIPRDEEDLPPSLRPARWANWGERREYFQTVPDLGLHIIERLMQEPFDIAQLREQPADRSIGHAFIFIRNRLMVEKPIPMVPIFINTYFPPNQPTAARCYAFGQALRRAIESFPGDLRVGIAGSGGLSHFVVDEIFDHKILDALKKRDSAVMGAIGQNDLTSGTSEVRNWIAVAGAVEHLGLGVLDYVPTYRSEAGTGCGMAFARWS